jgi:hypothetical protein
VINPRSLRSCPPVIIPRSLRSCPPVVTIERQSKRGKSRGDTRRRRSGLVGGPCHPRNVSQTFGRPASEPGAGWAVVDVETLNVAGRAAPVTVSRRPRRGAVATSRLVFTRGRHGRRVAALALGDDGNVEGSFSTLLNPGVDPGPTHVHGLTRRCSRGSHVR